MYSIFTTQYPRELFYSWWKQSDMALHQTWLQCLTVYLYWYRCWQMAASGVTVLPFEMKWHTEFLFWGFCAGNVRVEVYRGALYRGLTVSEKNYCMHAKSVWQSVINQWFTLQSLSLGQNEWRLSCYAFLSHYNHTQYFIYS